MIRRANEEGITVAELAERFIAEYFKDADGLGIKHATIHPRATENIDSIISLIKTLEDKGYAYKLKNTKKVFSKYQTRYFSVEGTSYVGAENEENINNNWLFISETQKNAYLDYKAKYNEAKNYASNEKVEANVTLFAKLKEILSDKAKATYASYEGENGDQMVLSNIIEEIKTYLNSTSTGIDNVNATSSAKAEAIFSVNGVRNAQLNKGLNIVKMSDGSVKKIMIK